MLLSELKIKCGLIWAERATCSLVSNNSLSRLRNRIFFNRQLMSHTVSKAATSMASTINQVFSKTGLVW